MPGVLLKLLVKDKLPHSREVPMNAKEWQLKIPPTSTKGWRLKPPRREREKITADEHTNQHERLPVETPEEREHSILCKLFWYNM